MVGEVAQYFIQKIVKHSVAQVSVFIGSGTADRVPEMLL
jgi:hypothetical protein